MSLISPPEYLALTAKEKAEICNGCGARDGINVPDTILGLSIKEPCQIHDYFYSIGTTNTDKSYADDVFFFNMVMLISKGNFFLRPFRLMRAYDYYMAVVVGGDSAFWRAK